MSLTTLHGQLKDLAFRDSALGELAATLLWTLIGIPVPVNVDGINYH
jgi:hypothetical protein